jgi:DNA modification methylase
MIRHTLPGGVTLFHADCRDALRSLPDNTIDSVPCDPPYELNFMGKGWDDTGIANDPALWREVFRVLKPGGHLAAFSASRTYHRMACAIEDAGFEIRDSLMWLYGTGFPKSQNVSAFIDKMAGAERPVVGYDASRARPNRANKTGPVLGDVPVTPSAIEFEGFGTALKPAFEPIVLARKPLSESTVAANVLRWRTGALNIDGCRIHSGESTARKSGVWLSADDGRTETFEGQSKEGRWPANVVTDGSDEVVAMFPFTKVGGSVAKGGKSPNPMDWGKDRTDSFVAYGGDAGSAARFFYSAKASKQDRNGSKHPTVKPIALMEWLATLITPPGGTVLDPFAGSGTTGIAAQNKGFSVILCEREAEYIADIRRRFGPAPAPFAADVAKQQLIRTEWAQLESSLRQACA